MQPSRLLWRRQADLLAADVTSLANATAMNLHLSQAPFTPGLDTPLSAMVEAAFPGYAAHVCGVGPMPVYYDAVTGYLTLVIKEPVGGFYFQSTAAPPAAETIYGWYLTDNANGILYGCGLLDVPAVIQDTDQGVDIGEVTLRFATNSPF